MTQEKKIVPKDEPILVSIKGIELTVDPQVLDDLETLELLSQLNPADDAEPNAFALIPLLKRLFGEKYKQVKNALRNKETGRITMEEVSSFVSEYLSKVSPNSSRS